MLERITNALYEPSLPQYGGLRALYGPRNGVVTGAILGIGVTLATAVAAHYAPEFTTELIFADPSIQKKSDLETIVKAGVIVTTVSCMIGWAAGYIRKKLFPKYDPQ